MKNIEIDGKKLVIYEDGSIRIPHKDINLCFDFMDIALLFKEAKNALNQSGLDSYSPDRNIK